MGDVVEGEMVLNDFGWIVDEEWSNTGELRKPVALDVYRVMPNHFHGIVWLTNEPEKQARQASPLPKPLKGPEPGSLGAVVGGVKSASTRRINQERGTAGVVFWQRNYWERIIRNERELEAIRRYIWNNPANWRRDQLHPGDPARAR